MNQTEISWTQLTWNPMSGCKAISAECAFCYADSLSSDKAGTAAFPHGFGLTLRPHKLAEPSRLKAPSLIFCNSMSDPGLDDAELTPEEIQRMRALGFATFDAYRDRIFDAVESAPRHRYQMLTKRPARLLQYFLDRGHPIPPSMSVGVTIGDDHPRSTGRLGVLRRFRDLGARVLFISAEPLLAPFELDLSGIDWLITGGESGRHASDPKSLERRFLVRRGDRRAGEPSYVPREDRMDWVRRLRDEAERAGCAHWFKQWGGPKPTSGGRVLDGRTHDGMPAHIPSAMPHGYVHRVPTMKGADHQVHLQLA